MVFISGLQTNQPQKRHKSQAVDMVSRMTQERAIEFAREVAKTEGWPWLEPVRIIRFRRWWIGSIAWKIVSNADKRGTNVRIVIDDSTSRVIKKDFLRR